MPLSTVVRFHMPSDSLVYPGNRKNGKKQVLARVRGTFENQPQATIFLSQ